MPREEKHLVRGKYTKRQLNVATVVVSQRTTSSRASDPKEAVERILRAIEKSPHVLLMMAPKSTTEEPFAVPRPPGGESHNHDKKVVYVLMALVT